MQEPNSFSWDTLRSDIYLRDKGMCWICNTFANLNEYHLGHLVDKSNGGHDDYDNLAVMHKSRNLAKPYHNTSEECLKWKLTAFIPKIQHDRGTVVYSHPIRIKRPYPRTFRSSPNTLTKQRAQYDEQVTKIKPATVVWIQGRPAGGAMWRVLPPPYRKEDMFVMRLAPPGAIDNGKHNIIETFQILGGILEQDIYIEFGTRSITILANNSNPIIKFGNSPISNTGKGEDTIGMGKNQIPIQEWHIAKAQGISLKEFKRQYQRR